jgi:hypothetical protein
LGCDDESASDDEQAEKILYFYPPSTPLERQLSRVTMIEGLIEFAGKFSPDSIETVLMEKQLWSFYPAEPDVWIVAAVQIAPDDDASGLTMHRADSLGLDAVVKKLYTFVSTFITAGSVNGHIDRDWERIMEVKQLRKRARKLRIRLRQEEQDCESIRRHEELKNSKAAEQESAEEGTIDIDVDGDKGDVQEIGEGNDADRPQSEQPSEDVPDTDATTRDRDPPNGVEGAVQEAADTSVLRVDAGAAGQEEEVVEREEREGEREVDTPEDNGEVDEDMEEEHLGIRAGMMSLSEILKQINETSAEILAAEEGITAMVADGYVISLLKAKLEYFLNWYVRTGELLSPSFITACGGMHYASVPDSALSRLLQIKYRLQDELNERFLGFSVLVNGQLAWHEIPGETEFQTLYEFIRLQEAERVRSLARNSFSPIVPNAPINGERTLSSGQKLTVTDLAIRRLFAPATGKSAGSSSNKLQLFDIKAQEYLESLLLSSGFISSYWQDIDHPSEIFDDSFTRASIDSDILDWTSIGTGIKIWCPRLNPATSIPADKDSRVPRVVLFRHGRFIAITMLSEDLFVGFDEKAEVEGRSASESKHSLFETLMAIKQIYEDSFQSLQSILDDSSKMPVPTVTTKPSSGSNSKQTSAPAVRVFYYNFCGAATKVSCMLFPFFSSLSNFLRLFSGTLRYLRPRLRSLRPLGLASWGPCGRRRRS